MLDKGIGSGEDQVDFQESRSIRFEVEKFPARAYQINAYLYD